MSYCDDFKNGLCERTGMHVPRSWCLEACAYYNKPVPDGAAIVTQEPPKPKPPTLAQMAEHFAKAMVKWAGSGFETVDEQEYLRRRTICSECSGGWRCPRCGCMLRAKAALKTETCDKW